MNLSLFADLDPHTLWNAPNNSAEMIAKCVIVLILGVILFAACFYAPTHLRRYLVFGFTFISGLFYVAFFYYPQPIAKGPADAPRNVFEGISFWLTDAQPVVATMSNTIAAFLLGLGVYSLLRVHVSRIARQTRDWQFSVVLIVSMALMAVFGYWNFHDTFGPRGPAMAIGPTSGSWHFQQYAYDVLFNGLLQQMDAGMFSLVAFYILSAAYRAFRARSVEATILLVSALILIFSVMGAVVYKWDTAVTDHLAGHNASSWWNNLKLSEMAQWLKTTVQTPSIRGIDFGVGIGLLAMGLRIWLNLDKVGGSSQ